METNRSEFLLGYQAEMTGKPVWRTSPHHVAAAHPKVGATPCTVHRDRPGGSTVIPSCVRPRCSSCPSRRESVRRNRRWLGKGGALGRTRTPRGEVASSWARIHRDGAATTPRSRAACWRAGERGRAEHLVRNARALVDVVGVHVLRGHMVQHVVAHLHGCAA